MPQYVFHIMFAEIYYPQYRTTKYSTLNKFCLDLQESQQNQYDPFNLSLFAES